MRYSKIEKLQRQIDEKRAKEAYERKRAEREARRKDFNDNVSRPAGNFSRSFGAALGILGGLVLLITLFTVGSTGVVPYEITEQGSTYLANEGLVFSPFEAFQRVSDALYLSRFGGDTSGVLYWISAPFRFLGSVIGVIMSFFGA